MNPNPLRCIDRLEVGPASVGPSRVAVRYTVWRAGERAETELVYKYEEPVFGPSDPDARNLASMVGAQAALNYALFCDEIVFHGDYDEDDVRLLTDMARNTNREILVNKLLAPNPFVVGLSLSSEDAFALPGAKLDFPDLRAERKHGTQPWSKTQGRCAVLSSGGKESLLSYGLLDEIGCEVHPIFINESGRHWYTALNAHRTFRARVQTTGRVWTNIDRLYNWMLRHLPFVRQDFGKLRADQYPIRLWTVAGFVFGALPLMRARGVSRLVIGDEYDTTLRLNHRGLSHYGGLYDQSRFFDRGLTRYYDRKGWGVVQFSILRSLSELLIQKMLAERYPGLHRDQVSCHAAHLDDDRALPCGRCEKCRRVVGMLVAAGADPQVCGYRRDQIDQALDALKTRDVHQEAATAEHVLYMLAQQGRLPSDAPAARSAKAHPEVLKMRFDAERSPFDVIPPDLRGSLHRIYRQHADGAVRRSSRAWVACDPTSQDVLQSGTSSRYHGQQRRRDAQGYAERQAR
ncbi:MAG: hypothetical protein ACOC1F_02460 [Myxococcota bacterium]